MPKEPKAKISMKQAAEKAKPGWRAVTPVESDAPRAAADESTPELDELRRKYLGRKANSAVKKALPRKGKPEDLSMVVMEPITASDTRVGRKVIVLDKRGKKIGDQG